MAAALLRGLLTRRAEYDKQECAPRPSPLPSPPPKPPAPDTPHAAVGITAIKFTCIPRTRAARRRRPTDVRPASANNSPTPPPFLPGCYLAASFFYSVTPARKYSFTASLRSPCPPRPCVGVIIVPGARGRRRRRARAIFQQREPGRGSGGGGRATPRSLLIALSIAPRSSDARDTRVQGSSFSRFREAASAAASLCLCTPIGVLCA